MGTVVTCTENSTVRVKMLGDEREVLAPAKYFVPFYRVMRRCHDDGLGDWQAWSGNHVARGATPWQALLALDDELGRRRGG